MLIICISVCDVVQSSHLTTVSAVGSRQGCPRTQGVGSTGGGRRAPPAEALGDRRRRRHSRVSVRSARVMWLVRCDPSPSYGDYGGEKPAAQGLRVGLGVSSGGVLGDDVWREATVVLGRQG